MTPDSFYRLFAILAVFAELGTIVIFVLWIMSKRSAVGRQRWNAAKAAVQPLAAWLAVAVAATATSGSLYLSEVAHLPPCNLCWVQRGFMYPQVLILAVFAVVHSKSLRRSTDVHGSTAVGSSSGGKPIRMLAAVYSSLGLCVSIYHYLYERFPDSVSTVCDTKVPCSTVWIWEFHYLSIPAMAGSGFAFILALLALSSPIKEEISA